MIVITIHMFYSPFMVMLFGILSGFIFYRVTARAVDLLVPF